jgi:hypothetical protein
MLQRHQLGKGRPEDLAYRSWMGRSATPGPRRLTPILNWSGLIQADQVVVYGHGTLIASGRVDMAARDGSVLWLQADGADGRHGNQGGYGSPACRG